MRAGHCAASRCRLESWLSRTLPAIDPASNKLASVNALARQYDPVGNTTSDGAGLVSVYNARNRLIQTTAAGLTTHYAHNAFGERVCKASSGPNCVQSADRSEYVYDEQGHLIGEYAQNLADHSETLWLGDTPIAVLKRRPGSSDGGPTGGGNATAWNGQAVGGVDVYFIHPDHLDTPRVIVNASNQEIWRWDSAPFGDTAANEQPTPSLPAFTLNLRFPGQQYDRETGTHYNYFRDYEPGSGRYVQSDPMGIFGGLATFGYSEQSPLSFADTYGLVSHGHHSDPKFLGGAVNQPLTSMCACDHQNLHKDMNEFLDTGVDPKTGKTMRPKRGNSGAVIRGNFSRGQCLGALAAFYKSKGSKYSSAASDFFKQHPHLK